MVVDFLQRLQAVGGAGAQVPITKLGELLAVHAVAGLALRMHEMRVGRAFVVHRQHGATGICRAVLAVAANVEKLHAIVVVAHTLTPVVGFYALVAEGWDGCHQAVTRGMQHAEGVASWQHHAVGNAFAHGGKAEFLFNHVIAAATGGEHG